ncbi:MAG: hypothetical protein QY323_02270 [Patescibacteria group bacterium]|nr:MAG: hypothetical protein QY323_02270 [Patescibacteria group bacterium]
MRVLSLVFLLTLVACGSSSKRSGKPVTSEALTVQVGSEALRVVFDAPGWRVLPDAISPDQVILVDPSRKERGVAVWVKYAKPGSTVKAALSEFGMMILAVPVLFSQPEQVGDAEIVSEEAASFAFRGVDSRTKKDMIAFCQVRIVSGHGTAYWAMILVYGAEIDGPTLIIEARRLAQTFRIEAPQAP